MIRFVIATLPVCRQACLADRQGAEASKKSLHGNQRLPPRAPLPSSPLSKPPFPPAKKRDRPYLLGEGAKTFVLKIFYAQIVSPPWEGARGRTLGAIATKQSLQGKEQIATRVTPSVFSCVEATFP